jgi:hypothetical protein
LRDPNFIKEQEAKDAEHAWYVTQPKTFYEGIEKLVDRWTEYVEKVGRHCIETNYRALYPRR